MVTEMRHEDVSYPYGRGGFPVWKFVCALSRWFPKRHSRGRMDPEIHDLFGVIGTWMETNAFLEGSTVGEKYRASAELGRELYQLTEEGLADPNQ
jgi:hypothetical protein